MKFDVYDSKNPERKLGTVEASPRSRYPYFRMPLLNSCSFETVEYDPDVAPVATHVVFHQTLRSETEQVPQPTVFTEQRITTSWTVFETSAPLSDLMRLSTFHPEGSGSYLARRSRREFF